MEREEFFIHNIIKKLFTKKEKKQISRYFISNLSLRVFSSLIDFCFLFFPLYFILLTILPLEPLFEGALFLKDFNFFTYITIYIFYGVIVILSWYYFNGATIGKKILRLKIVDFESKEDLSFKQFFIRYLTYIIYFVPLLFLISFLMSYFREDKRTLHDILSSTQVISTDNNFVD